MQRFGCSGKKMFVCSMGIKFRPTSTWNTPPCKEASLLFDILALLQVGIDGSVLDPARSLGWMWMLKVGRLR